MKSFKLKVMSALSFNSISQMDTCSRARGLFHLPNVVEAVAIPLCSCNSTSLHRDTTSMCARLHRKTLEA
jgi:hypothetical protein